MAVANFTDLKEIKHYLVQKIVMAYNQNCKEDSRDHKPI